MDFVERRFRVRLDELLEAGKVSSWIACAISARVSSDQAPSGRGRRESADSPQFVQVCRVWVAQGKPIRATLRYDPSSWTDATSMVLELTDPTGALIGSRTWMVNTQGEAMAATAGLCTKIQRGKKRRKDLTQRRKDAKKTRKGVETDSPPLLIFTPLPLRLCAFA
jgi:hypothetical protein